MEEKIFKNVEKVLKNLKETPKDLGGTIKYYRKMKKISQESLAENSFVSKSYIRKLESGDIYNINVNNLVLICLALKLEYECSLNIFYKAGLGSFFTLSNIISITYNRILMTEGKINIYEINDYLKELGLKPLIKSKAA